MLVHSCRFVVSPFFSNLRRDHRGTENAEKNSEFSLLLSVSVLCCAVQSVGRRACYSRKIFQRGDTGALFDE